ncbi:MAG: hypothetical protein U0350_50275 [Caldilineaceae bacterium]
MNGRALGVALDPTNTQQMAALAHSVARVHGSDPSAVPLVAESDQFDYVWRILRSVALIQKWLVDSRSGPTRRPF